MAPPTTPGVAQIPATTSPVEATKNPFDKQAGPSGQDESDTGPSNWDYTENAPQGVVDAVVIERAREAQEGPPDMISGSLGSWGMEQGMS
jgi:hypothetical protein